MPKEDILEGAVQGGILGTVGAGIMIAFWDAHRLGLPSFFRDSGDLTVLALSIATMVTGSVAGAIISGCSSRFFSSAEQPRQGFGDFSLEAWMDAMDQAGKDDELQAQKVALRGAIN